MKAIVYYINGTNRIFDMIISIAHEDDNFVLKDSNNDTILIPRENVEFIKVLN